MKKCVLVLLVLILAAFCLISWEKSEPKEVFGACILDEDFENLTQQAYTAHLQEAYGLDTLQEHRVYHNNGSIQVDFLFSGDMKEWQAESAQKFAVDKFYFRDTAKYDLWDYDVWLIEHSQEECVGVTYRVFQEDVLILLGHYPDAE